MREPTERLRDIVEAAERVERYVQRGRPAYDADELLQVWMVHHIQLIGKAARYLPDEVRAAMPEVPWAQVVGMRHILVHGYFDIDVALVWTTATRDIPVLRAAAQRVLADRG